MSVFSSTPKKMLYASSRKTTTSNVLAIPHQRVICRITHSKNKINKLEVTSRGILFCPSSNNTPSSATYRVDIKRKAVPEEKSNEELPAGIGHNSNYSPLVVDIYLRMRDMTL